MDKSAFIKTLEKGNNKLENRNLLINSCLKDPTLISILLQNMRAVDDKNSTFSARILELTCKEKLDCIIPYFDPFTELLRNLKLEGSIRSSAKICELVIIVFFSTKNIYFKNKITEKQHKKIIEASFDWMIGTQKTAVKAYSMQTLYLLGTLYDWIHPELVLIIEKNIPKASVGFANRGRKVIKAIQTGMKLKL